MIVADDGSGFPFSGAYSLDELEILAAGPEEHQTARSNFGRRSDDSLAATAGFRRSTSTFLHENRFSRRAWFC